jgi:hypothetical protein
MPPKDDPFEFDPFSDMAPAPAPEPEPQARPQAAPRGDRILDVESLFGEVDLPPESEPEYAPEPTLQRPEPPRAKALQIDFTDVLGSEREMRGAQRIGGSVLDNDEFLSRKDREAIERAKVAPVAALPSTLEFEERAAGYRVVHESRRFWFWFAVAIIVPAVLIISGLTALIRYREAQTEREIEQLRRDEVLRHKDQQR